MHLMNTEVNEVGPHPKHTLVTDPLPALRALLASAYAQKHNIHIPRMENYRIYTQRE